MNLAGGDKEYAKLYTIGYTNISIHKWLEDTMYLQNYKSVRIMTRPERRDILYQLEIT